MRANYRNAVFTQDSPTGEYELSMIFPKRGGIELAVIRRNTVLESEKFVAVETFFTIQDCAAWINKNLTPAG